MADEHEPTKPTKEPTKSPEVEESPEAEADRAKEETTAQGESSDAGEARGLGRDASRALRSVGERLGRWGRRVGELVADVSGRPVVPEILREPLARARRLRVEGDHDAAVALLRELLPAHPEQPHLRFALGLSLVHALVLGERRLDAMSDVEESLGTVFGEGPRRLLRAARLSSEGRPEPALDELRRAVPDLGKLSSEDEAEARFLLHLLAGLAQRRLGYEERALRELQKARVRLPPEAGDALRSRVLRHGVELSLAADLLVDAELWVRETLRANPEHAVARELLCRVLAAKGDRLGAQALLEELGESPELDPTRIFVGSTVGLVDDADAVGLRALALRNLQHDPADPARRRAWALAELAPLQDDPEKTLSDALRPQVLEALVAFAAAAPRATRDRALQELAHVALRLDVLDETVAAPIDARLREDEATAPEELRLLRARRRLRAKGEDEDVKRRLDADFLPGTPPRFRAAPEVGGPWGPDPTSPVRNPDLRGAVLASQRLLAAAELCLAREGTQKAEDDQGWSGHAQDLLVSALVEWPGLRCARVLLAEITHPPTSARLEDLLAGATKLLAAVPNRVRGISLEGVADALARVIAARERLVRPLTIAIMGEFSAGKSTFVNALLGEPVAPMGVLPTTTTINVFRRGPTGGARVHYRDGRIATLEPAEVQKFLHALDDTEANRIRHVEIERTGKRTGDAAVVDTPGLNALDAFHEQVAREFLDEADAVVWVFSATRSGAATEVGMLSELRDSGRQVLGVLNKVDTLDPAEQEELAAYLREQLGEVLVEVVPLRGRDALEYRTAKRPTGDDPFAEVEDALERHFLQRARELKRALTARRLSEALVSARAAALQAVEALETMADAAGARAHRRRAGAQALLLAFADDLRAGVLDVDDALLREGLGIGVLQTGKGMTKGPLDPLDAEYLATVFRDAAMAALQRALSKVAHADPAASEVLDRRLVPWAHGHIEGLVAGRFIEDTLAEHGKKIAEGEGTMRAGFREALEPVAETWVAHARSLARDVEQARIRAERRATSAPRAEALRLRTGVLAAIDALREAVDAEQALEAGS
jgi:GTPase SAR1 family protein